MDFFDIQIVNTTRHFPIVSLGPKLKIVSFNILGDLELAHAAADELCKKIKNLNFDYLVGPETTVVPLIHEMSEILKINRYVILRKQIHGYMTNPVFTDKNSNLVINGPDADLITGKKVVIVDDVVSTGKTTQTILELMKLLNTQVIAKTAILKQGDVFDEVTNDLIYLGKLPIFHV